MARVVVVGGGLGGLATAARLAKLRHDVILFEAAEHLGGAVGEISQGDFTWDTGPSHTLIPAVLRDLFRKSGRPLEAELDLTPIERLREHRFADGSRVEVPAGSRGRQHATFEALAPGLGTAWIDYVAEYADDWDLIRRDYLERPFDPEVANPAARVRLRSRATLAHRARRLPDARLRAVATAPFTADGHDPHRVPAWAGLVTYAEQRFGAWTVVGGFTELTTALTRRLATRRVEVHTGAAVDDVMIAGGRVTGVVARGERVEADIVVCAVDPRALPSLRHQTRRIRSTTLPWVTHVGLDGPPDLGVAEVLLHHREGAPIVIRPSGRAPDGAGAWTLSHRLGEGHDPLALLAAAGVDVRRRVVVRIDRSPAELEQAWGGSPLGVQWRGRATTRRRPGPGGPVEGLLHAGAHATPGAGVPFVGLSAALVAQAVGPA